MLAGANEVYDTAFFGTEFQSPVGINSPDSYQMFEYTALAIMASADNTEVKVDADRNGIFEQIVTINEGETVFVNGGVKVGGRVVADKPVQVDLLTGDIGSNYESRFFRLLPTSTWTSALTAPVASATTVNNTASGTTVWLYNPTASEITIKQTSRSSANATTLSTSNIKVPANGNASVVLVEGCAARFESTKGANFYALSAIDSTAKNSNGSGNQTWDWGYALVPDDALTSQVLVGLGIGRDPTSSTKPNENGSPVWVTPIGNGNTPVRVYVDYDSDPTTGSAAGVDANGNKYDVYYDLKELVSQKIFNPSGNQTGVLIYTVKDGVKLAAAWGADPRNSSTGAPGLDFGTGIPPLPAFFMQKTSKLLTDSDGDDYITPNDVIQYDIMIENVGRQPITDLRVRDVLPSSISYIPNSTTFTDENGVVSSIADLAATPKFPLGKSGGYLLSGFLPIASNWHIVYDTQVGPFNANAGIDSIKNNASVSSGATVYTNGVIDALRGRVGDYVWLDTNMNGIQDAGETGVNGVSVRLLNADGTQAFNDFDVPYESVTRTDDDAHDGFYLFTGVRPGQYIVEFLTPSGYAFTQHSAGISADKDSNAGTGATPNATGEFRLDGGQFKLDVDAGLIKLGSIAGSTFIDHNGDGIVDPEDTAPIFGVTVELLNTEGTVVATTTTQADGSYSFIGLLPGNYTVRQTDSAGWISTKDTAGANDNLIGVALGFGQDSVGNNFYDTMPVSIGDRVWIDSNRNGIQDSGELGLAGVDVQLLNASGTVVATTTTDDSGNYLFENKNPGTYSVQFIAPVGYVFTAQNAGVNDAIDSNAAGDGSVAAFTLPYGAVDLKIDAGLFHLTAGVEIIKTAGDAPDGQVFSFVGTADVVYTYVVKNIGQTYLSNLVVTDDKLGTIGTVTGPLAPNATATLYATALAVSEDVTNIGTVVATPTDSEGVPLLAMTSVTDNDDAVVAVSPEIPTPDPTICELLDFGKIFNAIIFGNFNVVGGDTEGNLLVWGNASLPAGYSVGQPTVGEPMPIAGTYDDALIVGGDLYIGPQGINGNVVYGGTYSGFDRKYQSYAVRHVTPVTLDDNGNVPEDHSGMTRDDMAAQVLALSARLAAMEERGVVSKDKAENGSLILTGNDTERNIFTLDIAEWNGSSVLRTLVVPPESSVIINIYGDHVAISGGDMVLPDGMTPNQVLIHYVDAIDITISSFTHEGSVIAPYADAILSGGSVQGQGIFGGDVTTSIGFEFHNFPMNIFDCPTYPSVRIIATANDARDGSVLQITSSGDILVRQTVINNGSSWLRSVTLTAADGSVVNLGDLAPNSVAVFDTTVPNAGIDAVYTASVAATPSNADSSPITGFTSVTDSDIVAVVFADGTAGMDPGAPGTTTDPIPSWYKPDLVASEIWFSSAPTITGEVFTVSVKVENQGDTTSTGGAINLYLAGLDHSLSSADANEVPAASLALGTLISGEVKVFTFNNLVAQSDPGQYRAIALVDPYNEIAEKSEGNNHATLTYALNAVSVQISVGAHGVTLTWNNYWGQLYTVMVSPDLEEWAVHSNSQFQGIRSARDVDGSTTNMVTLPFSDDAQFFKLRVDQQ